MKKTALILLLPVLVAGGILFYVPLAMNIHLSLFKTNYISSVFVGLGNYVKAFGNPVFLRILVNSCLYAFFFMAVQTTTAVVITFLSVGLSMKWQNYIRIVVFIPTFTAGLVMATVYKWIFHPTAGLANWLLSLLNIEPVIWLGNRMSGMFATAASLVFAVVGENIILLMAAEKGINRDLYESAKMDGAREWQIRMRITLPLIAPTIFVILLLQMLTGFQMWETIYLMSPVQSANNLMFDIWDTAFSASRYGLGAAKSVILMVILVTISLVKKKIESRTEY